MQNTLAPANAIATDRAVRGAMSVHDTPPVASVNAALERFSGTLGHAMELEKMADALAQRVAGPLPAINAPPAMPPAVSDHAPGLSEQLHDAAGEMSTYLHRIDGHLRRLHDYL